MSNPNARVLFILKFRENYDGTSTCTGSGTGLNSGLYNSAMFVNDMLLAEGVESKLVQVIDNNGIDREVYNFQPTHVVIEALWVVPDKFQILKRLHPGVTWIVRIHSELPFLANESMAVDWLCRYVQMDNVYVSGNSEHVVRDLRTLIKEANPNWAERVIEDKVILLTNYYPYDRRVRAEGSSDGNVLNVGCFGAIRPMKNQLLQAVAAIEFASILGRELRFHINATRFEQGGNANLANIRALFAHTGHQLVEHAWLPHDEFLQLLTEMDFGMQVTLSETFNIVSADMVAAGLPVVVSPEVTWASSWIQAEATNSEDIVLKMLKAWDWRLRKVIQVLNYRGLRSYANDAKRQWLQYLNNA